MKAIQKNFQKKLKINQQLAYDLNDFLARNPEISGQEFQSVAYILSVLKKKNILIEENVAGLNTAFIAHVIEGEPEQPKIGIIMEYDALPEIGHACGHCASGSLSLLAALTLKEMANEVPASIDLIGTPNEEVTGDKIKMAFKWQYSQFNF